MCPMSRILAFIFLSTLILQQTFGSAKQPKTCSPSSCGIIPNISHPFRLNSDPKHCGDRGYELNCEDNVTTLSLFSGKYRVLAINYNNYTIRLVDAGLKEDNCSSFPSYFLSESNFTDTYDSYESNHWSKGDPFHAGQRQGELERSILLQHIVYLNCSIPVRDDTEFVDTAACISWPSKGYIYAIPGDLFAGNVKDGCHVKFAATMSWNWSWVRDNKSLSYADVHRQLLHGFELSWLFRVCQDRCANFDYCYFNSTLHCVEPYYFCGTPLGLNHAGCGNMSKLRILFEDYISGVYNGLRRIARLSIFLPYEGYSVYRHVVDVGEFTGRYVLPYLTARFFCGVICLIVLIIYKWHRRHISMYDGIEDFLQGNSLIPIRYSYKEIKKMTRGFSHKLGEGGYGTVYKGKLCSGPFVAIKMLGKSKANGQEFISEVATIGRIYHVNVVRLIGFCAEGSKRALVYEFMPNGSLDKYIFSKEGNLPLSHEEIYQISLGVARGISYLHQGCDMQILHFDIKPHNILLDENFIPKVSDFGLAKLYPIDNSIVTLTAARGTLGYMAPELFYKNIGGVSYKADVYSFGMLLMEMASKRKNLNPHVEHSSQLYFPLWIYDQLHAQKDIELDDVREEEKNLAKKMFIVALWCIQLKPMERPSINQVLQMLEKELESLEMPPKPSLYPHETVIEDDELSSDVIDSNDLTSSTSYISEIVTNPLLKNSA